MSDNTVELHLVASAPIPLWMGYHATYQLALEIKLVCTEFVPRWVLAERLPVDPIRKMSATAGRGYDASVAVRRRLRACSQGRDEKLGEVEMT